MARPRSYHINLSKKERKTIRNFQKKPSSPNSCTRCAILPAADPDGRHEKSYAEIASSSGACVTTLIKTLKKSLNTGFTKMITPARSSRSDMARLKVTGDVEAKTIAASCSPAPKERVRWTLNLLYNQMMVVLEDNKRLNSDPGYSTMYL